MASGHLLLCIIPMELGPNLNYYNIITDDLIMIVSLDFPELVYGNYEDNPNESGKLKLVNA